MSLTVYCISIKPSETEQTFPLLLDPFWIHENVKSKENIIEPMADATFRELKRIMQKNWRIFSFFSKQ